MRIGVIGGGFVGHAVARGFMEHVEVRVYDVDPRKATHSRDDTLDSEIVFVCLPTPDDDGECDTSALDGFFERVNAYDCLFVIKSTVPVGYTRGIAERGIRVVHSPEFLTARCAVTDFQVPARNIVGVSNGVDWLELSSLYERRFPGVPVHVCTSDESELIKLACNSFFALKVGYFNHIYALCESMGLEWETVRQGILSDGRIAHSHTQVPGPDGKLGFGGACLPKDLLNLAHVMDENGVDSRVLKAVSERNREMRCP